MDISLGIEDSGNATSNEDITSLEDYKYVMVSSTRTHFVWWLR